MDALRRGAVLAASMLAITGAGLASSGTVLAGAASAQTTNPNTIGCGAVITHSITLTQDLGPCTGDGLVVTGSHISINLGGHTITGSHQVTTTPANEQVGVHLKDVTGDTVSDGTIGYFDGGVVIDGGSHNTVTGITAHDNINRDLLSNTPIPPTLSLVGAPGYQPQCNYGDGISTFSSSYNNLTSNTLVHNGPFSGIALVGSSSHNSVSNNVATDNYVVDQTPNGGGTLCGSSVGVITGGMSAGRTVQDMGIRVEGSGATFNRILNNQVSHSGLDGIAIFDWFCNLHGKMHLPPTHNNSIINNTVMGTGDLAVQAATGQVDSGANGIAVLSEGNGGVNCTSYDDTISNNRSTGNFQDGIYLGGMPSAPGHPQDTTISNNQVSGNHLDGIGVQQGAVGAKVFNNSASSDAEFDGADYNFNPNCGTDKWHSNSFGSVNQPCVANSGTGSVTQVLFTGASGVATGLQTNWSGLVHVTNPAGITVYSGTDSSCAIPIATGKAPVSGDGTNSPTVSLTTLPPPGNAYFEVAANSVSAGPGVSNAAVGCTGVTFSGTPTVDTVTSVAITGSLAAPTFTVTGTNFGSSPPPPDPSTPPDGQQGCPASPNANPQGYLYGTNLYVSDQSSNGFDAGVNSVTGEFDCVGIVVQSWSPTKVVFTLGNLYDQSIPGNQYVLANGDPVQVVVLGAVGSTTVSGLS